jgi:hypothetical protein
MKRTSRTPCKLPDPLHHRLKAYALAASTAGVSLLALADSAQAKIVYTPGDVTFAGSSDRGTYYLDLNHDGIPDFMFAWTEVRSGGPRRLALSNGPGPAWTAIARLAVQPLGNNGVVGKPHSGFQGPYNGAFCLGSGASIGPRKPFSGSLMANVSLSVGGASGRWLYPGHIHSITGSGEGNIQGYLGLKFAIHGQTHYGWARLNVFANWGTPVFTASLLGYAYETIPDKPIILSKQQGPCQKSPNRKHDKHANPASLGTVEPASLGRLAQGASGVAAWRRKEQPAAMTE